MRKRSYVPLLAVLAAACAEPTVPPAPQFGVVGVDHTQRGIAPGSLPGNFVASDDIQVCYELDRRGLLPGGVTTDMRGFKIDPPVNYNDGNVTTTLTNGGKFLDWTARSNVTVHAFIIKGGNSFNVFSYSGTDFMWDNSLFSPYKGKQLPQISHYNVCYSVFGGGGCTPGYWRNHADRWRVLSPSDDFDATFGVDAFSPNITLGQAIWLGGGGIQALARHATAGLLNAYGGVPNATGYSVYYAYFPPRVIEMVREAIANGTIEETKNLFQTANEAGCPLSGTRAVRVPN